MTNILKQTEEQREQLDRLVNELKDTIASQKGRIEELIRLNEEQEVLLKSQQAALDSKVGITNPNYNYYISLLNTNVYYS